LTRGGVHRLAKLDSKKQQRFLEELKENGKRPRKTRQGKKRARITLPPQPKALAQALLKKLQPPEIAEVYKVLSDALRGEKGKHAR